MGYQNLEFLPKNYLEKNEKQVPLQSQMAS